MLDTFRDLKKITKSHILVENVTIQIDFPIGLSTSVITNESKARLKCSRPLSSKDHNPRKKRLNSKMTL